MRSLVSLVIEPLCRSCTFYIMRCSMCNDCWALHCFDYFSIPFRTEPLAPSHSHPLLCLTVQVPQSNCQHPLILTAGKWARSKHTHFVYFALFVFGFCQRRRIKQIENIVFSACGCCFFVFIFCNDVKTSSFFCVFLN